MYAAKSAIYRLPLGLHLTIFALLSVFIAVGVPYSKGIDELNNTALQSLAVLYAVTVAFLMSISIGRRRSLQSMVLLELNKVRRMDHLAKNIVLQQPELQDWYVELHACLEQYLEFFRKHDIGEYEKGNALFRKVTYLVYSLPQRKTGFQDDLYAELLSTAGSATEAREYVGNLIAPSIGAFQLGVVLIISLALSIMTAATSPFDFFARLGVTLASFCTFLVLGMFYDYEFIGAKMKRTMADLYIENQQHLIGMKVE